MQKVINRTHIEGLLYQHSLELRESGPNSTNPGTKYITGTIEVATDNDCTNIVPVHYTYVTATTSTGKQNPNFATLSNIVNGIHPTVMKDGADKAVKLKIDSANKEKEAKDFINNLEEKIENLTKELEAIRSLIDKRQSCQLTADDNCILAVALKKTDEMVGEIVVMPNDGCFSLGYTFSYKHHRKGYAYEALSSLIDILHSRYPEMEFICFTEPENAPSIALLKKLGYTDYGYVEKITSNVFGKWIVGDPLK